MTQHSLAISAEALCLGGVADTQDHKFLPLDASLHHFDSTIDRILTLRMGQVLWFGLLALLVHSELSFQLIGLHSKLLDLDPIVEYRLLHIPLLLYPEFPLLLILVDLLQQVLHILLLVPNCWNRDTLAPPGSFWIWIL